MQSLSRLFLFLLSTFLSFPSSVFYGQSPSAAPSYPESAGGLEKLGKDVLKAQKDGDSARVDLLIRGMVMPDPVSWYTQQFGESIARKEGAAYQSAGEQVPVQL